jgi:hypothetical protein
MHRRPKRDFNNEKRKAKDMKNRFSLWTAIDIAIGIATEISSNNLPAALFIGTGTAMLLLIVTNLEVDRKIRN